MDKGEPMDQYDLIYVDDDSTMVAIFEQVIKLKYRHWRATSFADPLVIFEKISGQQIAARVWIIDLMMPKKNGVEIAQAIRAAGQADAVLIAYTALDPRALARRPEYGTGLHLFERIVGKQEGFIKILAGLDASVLRKIKT